jgi:DNA polymerase-3 subunit gamma/tau
VDELVSAGRDPQQFMRDLTAHLRQLVVVQAIGSAPDSFGLTADQTERLEAQSREITQLEAVRAIDLVAEALTAVKEGSEARLQLELALLKGARPRADASLEALLVRLERLEQTAGAPDDGGEPGGGESDGGSEPKPARRRITGAAAKAHSPAAERSKSETPIAGELIDRWPAVLENIRAGEGGEMLAALLEGARPLSLEEGRLLLLYPASAAFSKRKVESKANQARIADALQSVLGEPVIPRFELDEEAASSGETTLTLLSEEDAIAAFKEAFDAEDVAKGEDA